MYINIIVKTEFHKFEKNLNLRVQKPCNAIVE